MDKIARAVGQDPGDPFHQRLPQRDMKPHQKTVEDATLIEVIQAAAHLVGHELPEEFKQ